MKTGFEPVFILRPTAFGPSLPRRRKTLPKGAFSPNPGRSRPLPRHADYDSAYRYLETGKST